MLLSLFYLRYVFLHYSHLCFVQGVLCFVLFNFIAGMMCCVVHFEDKVRFAFCNMLLSNTLLLLVKFPASVLCSKVTCVSIVCN